MKRFIILISVVLSAVHAFAQPMSRDDGFVFNFHVGLHADNESFENPYLVTVNLCGKMGYYYEFNQIHQLGIYMSGYNPKMIHRPMSDELNETKKYTDLIEMTKGNNSKFQFGLEYRCAKDFGFEFFIMPSVGAGVLFAPKQQHWVDIEHDEIKPESIMRVGTQGGEGIQAGIYGSLGFDIGYRCYDNTRFFVGFGYTYGEIRQTNEFIQIRPDSHEITNSYEEKLDVRMLELRIGLTYNMK